MTSYGLRKFNSHYLPTIIHNTEHIYGVIYGRFAEAPGLLNRVDRRFTNNRCARIFMNYVEKRRLENYEEELLESKIAREIND